MNNKQTKDDMDWVNEVEPKTCDLSNTDREECESCSV